MAHAADLARGQWHHAYAKRALMKIPSLEDYEQRARTKANLTM
jgi:hypothetical protein